MFSYARRWFILLTRFPRHFRAPKNTHKSVPKYTSTLSQRWGMQCTMHIAHTQSWLRRKPLTHPLPPTSVKALHTRCHCIRVVLQIARTTLCAWSHGCPLDARWWFIMFVCVCASQHYVALSCWVADEWMILAHHICMLWNAWALCFVGDDEGGYWIWDVIWIIYISEIFICYHFRQLVFGRQLFEDLFTINIFYRASQHCIDMFYTKEINNGDLQWEKQA